MLFRSEREGGIDKVISVSLPAYRRIGIEAGKDGIEILSVSMNLLIETLVLPFIREELKSGILSHSSYAH